MDISRLTTTCRLLLAALLAVAAPAIAQDEDAPPDLLVTTGVEGGGYWSAGQRLQTVASEMGMSVINVTSTGSIDNLKRLTDPNNPVNMAFAQADAMEHYLLDNPLARQSLSVVENIGQECVFVMTGSDSDLRRDKDLGKSKGVRLGVPSATSGVAITLQYMTRLMPELANAEVVYGPTAEAVASLNSEEGGLDAVMVVHRPKERSAAMDAARMDNDAYRFLEISDGRFTENVKEGQEIYRNMRLAVPGLDEPVSTICVRGLLLLEKNKVDEDLVGKLATLVDYYWMRVYATP